MTSVSVHQADLDRICQIVVNHWQHRAPISPCTREMVDEAVRTALRCHCDECRPLDCLYEKTFSSGNNQECRSSKLRKLRTVLAVVEAPQHCTAWFPWLFEKIGADLLNLIDGIMPSLSDVLIIEHCISMHMVSELMNSQYTSVSLQRHRWATNNFLTALISESTASTTQRLKAKLNMYYVANVTQCRTRMALRGLNTALPPVTWDHRHSDCICDCFNCQLTIYVVFRHKKKQSSFATSFVTHHITDYIHNIHVHVPLHVDDATRILHVIYNPINNTYYAVKHG